MTRMLARRGNNHFLSAVAIPVETYCIFLMASDESSIGVEITQMGTEIQDSGLSKKHSKAIN
jgi:hypothetical protein